MRLALLIWALLAVAAHAAPAPPTVRALFVGIDDYPPEVNANLKGAVNDVRLMHASLAAAHGLKLDPLPAAGSCEAGGDRSITLLNGCATRSAILDRLDRLVRASAPGDTLIFYYAGHGAQTGTSTDGTQASDRHSTLVAADSRRPAPEGGGVTDDILDTVLKARIDDATAHGVQVVTIFDSCNSGTATRSADVASRFVEPAPAGDPADADTWKPRVPPPGTARAARVHLAAARDGEKALERSTEDGRHGLFTSALVDTAAANPGATYGEILQMVRARVQGQVPVGEGPLATTRFLGRATATDARLLAAEVSDGSLLLFDGTLSGIRVGSGFRLHRTAAEALAGTAPLGLARVVEATPQGARLAPVPAGLKPGETVQALEVARGVDARPLSVRFEGVDKRVAQKALAGLEGVMATTGPADLTVARRGAALLLEGPDGARLSDLSRISATDDAARIGEGLRRAANATALLRLPHKPSGARLGQLELTTASCADCRVQRGVADPQGSLVGAGDRFRLLVESQSNRPLYPYLFEVTPQFGISRLYPPGSASDQLPPGGFFHVGEAVRAARPGEFQLVLILSEVPLAAGPLEQGSLPRAGGCADGHALAQLLCAASRGARAAEALPTGDFDVITVPVTIGAVGKEGGK
jgi:hypothetical protein